MKRQHRLTQRRQFLDVRTGRVVAARGPVRVHAAANGGRPLRAGYAITGVKHAVDRNRIRRRLRALLDARLDTLHGVDLLVGAGSGCATSTFTQIEADLAACLAVVVPRALRGAAT